MMVLKRYFGDKAFYFKTAKIAVPLALQQMLTSAQSIVDTIMVTWINMVTPVGTAAQIDTLCNMIAYGVIGGVSMFSAQFYGANDEHNLKRSFGLSLVLALGNAIFWCLIASLFGEQILRFYMNDDRIIMYALEYLTIMRFSLIVGAITFCFSYMYRSCQKATIALNTSIIMTLLNCTFNYLFIFVFEMGVKGAALGTLLAQVIAAIFLVVYAYATKQPFVGSFAEMFGGLKRNFVEPIIIKIIPLIVNETLFGFGTTLFIKAFGQLGTKSMDAYYVANQIFNVFLFIVYGYGSAVQILLGSRLGKGQIEQAKQECAYHLGMSFILAIILVFAIVIFAPYMVDVFALSDMYVYDLAIKMMYVFAIKISMRLFNFIIFSILRSGGDTKIIQFLDSGLLYIVGLTLAFGCVNILHIDDIVLVLLITQLEQLVRIIFGLRRVATNIWAKDLTTTVI